MKCKMLISALALAFMCGSASAAEVKALCVDTFQGPMAEIAALFAKQTGNKVNIRYDKAGRLFGTILNETPSTEVIFTQDQRIPGRLVERNKAIDGTQVSYAASNLAIWSSKAGFVKAEKDFLASKDVTKVAIPRPNASVYGKLAMGYLTKAGIAKAVEPKIVKVDTVFEAVDAVKNGSAQVAFVDLGVVYKNGKFTSGSGYAIPKDMFKPVVQDAILLNSAKKNPTAAEFLKFVTENAEAKKIVKSYGYN